MNKRILAYLGICAFFALLLSGYWFMKTKKENWKVQSLTNYVIPDYLTILHNCETGKYVVCGNSCKQRVLDSQYIEIELVANAITHQLLCYPENYSHDEGMRKKAILDSLNSILDTATYHETIVIDNSTSFLSKVNWFNDDKYTNPEGRSIIFSNLFKPTFFDDSLSAKALIRDYVEQEEEIYKKNNPLEGFTNKPCK